MPKSPHETLKVKKRASKRAIKKAYRSLAMEFHPDRNPGDKAAAERFKEVKAAYDQLISRKTRITSAPPST